MLTDYLNTGWMVAFEQFVTMQLPGYAIPQAVYCCRLERAAVPDGGLMAEPETKPDDTQPVMVVGAGEPFSREIIEPDPGDEATEQAPAAPVDDEPTNAIVPAVRKVEGTIYTPIENMTFEEGLAAGLTGQELLDLSFARLQDASKRAMESVNRLFEKIHTAKADWDHKIETRHERVRPPEVIEFNRKNRAEQRARWVADRMGERDE
jgi:hypothetical protein